MAEVYYTEYKGWFCDTEGQDVNVEFKRRYTIDPNAPIQLIPEVKDISFSGHNDEPVKIDYPQGSITTKLNPINGSECSIGIKAIGDFELSDLYTADEKEWLVLITGAKTWQGFLIPDDCEEPFDSKPYDVRVSATDALGTLDEIPFTMDDGTRYRGFMSDLAVIRICLEKTGLSLPYTIGINTYALGQLGGTDPNTCFLAQMFIDTSRFIDEDGAAFSCKEVLRSILERNSARLHQVNGRWNIVNVLEQSYGTVKGWLFDANLNPNGSVPNMLNNVVGGGLDRDIIPVGNLVLQKAFLNSTAYYQYGYPSNKLKNGDMNAWETKPSELPDNWTTVGSITAIGKVRQVEGVDTEDYFIEISGQGDGYLTNSEPTLIRAGEKSIITFDMYAPGVAGTNGLDTLKVDLSILVTTADGSYFGNNGWQSSPTFYKISYIFRDLINQIRISFEVLSRPIDYNIYIGVKPLRTFTGTNLVTQINNAEIQQKQENELTKIALGEYVRQTSLAKQTYKPDPILLLHGVETIEDRTSRLSIGFPGQFVNVPTQWSRANIPGEAKELLMIVANTNLRIHSRPYRIFDAEFHGYADINPNTILTTDLLPGSYMFLSGSFDLKTNIHSLKFAEILTDDIPFRQEQRQDYGTENGKNKIDVANPVGVGNIGQIQYDPSLFIQNGQQTPAATNVQTQGESIDNAYVSPLKLGNWWAYKKGLDETFTGEKNFTSRPTYDGMPLLIESDIASTTGVVSDTATMNIDSDKENQVYSGSNNATWTAPGLSGNTWKKIFIKNRGAGILTIVSNTGGNDFYYTNPTTSLLVNPGDAVILINDGTYWNIN